jgi:hypothetical protein
MRLLDVFVAVSAALRYPFSAWDGFFAQAVPRYWICDDKVSQDSTPEFSEWQGFIILYPRSQIALSIF